MFSGYFNVENDVAYDVNRVNTAKKRLEEAQNRLKKAKNDNVSELAMKKDEVKEYREKQQTEADPIITRLDEVSMAKNFYDKIINSIGDTYRYTSSMIRKESKEFGYESKTALSMKLGVDSFRSQLAAGSPFPNEYKALSSIIAVDDSWDAMAEQTSKRGTPKIDDVNAAAIRLAHVIHEIRQHEDEEAKGARSFPERVKHAFSFAVDPSFHRRKQREARDFSTELITHVKNEDWGKAIDTADKAAEKLKLHTYAVNPLDYKPSIAREKALADGMGLCRYSPAGTYALFRQTASSMIAMQQLEKHCETSLVMLQYQHAETFFY